MTEPQQTDPVGAVANLASDVIREHGDRWVALNTKVETLEHLVGESMGSSKKVERAVMGYWDTTTNTRVRGLWDDVYDTKQTINIGKKVVTVIAAGVWAIALVVLGQAANSVFGFWGVRTWAQPAAAATPVTVRVQMQPTAKVSIPPVLKP